MGSHFLSCSLKNLLTKQSQIRHSFSQFGKRLHVRQFGNITVYAMNKYLHLAVKLCTTDWNGCQNGLRMHFIVATMAKDTTFILLNLPRNFTLIHIKASLRHVAHPPLGLLWGKGAEVVDIWSLVCDLEVADAAITLSITKKYNQGNPKSLLLYEQLSNDMYYLSTKVDHTTIWVIEGQQHSIAGVHLMNRNGLFHIILQRKHKDYSDMTNHGSLRSWVLKGRKWSLAQMLQ